jgi:hypothetical protein
MGPLASPIDFGVPIGPPGASSSPRRQFVITKVGAAVAKSPYKSRRLGPKGKPRAPRGPLGVGSDHRIIQSGPWCHSAIIQAGISNENRCLQTPFLEVEAPPFFRGPRGPVSRIDTVALNDPPPCGIQKPNSALRNSRSPISRDEPQGLFREGTSHRQIQGKESQSRPFSTAAPAPIPATPLRSRAPR